MPLNPFIAQHVSPGEPLTAQAWNDLVDGVDGLHQHVQAQLHAVRVKIQNAGLDLTTVRVTAISASGVLREAVPPVPPGDTHVIDGLVPGAYTIQTSAPGFAPASGMVNIGQTGDAVLELALTRTHVPMPDVFGMTLTQARAALSAKAITVSRLLDTQGKNLPPNNPGPEYDLSLVLVQVPPAGSPVGVAGGTVQLAVAVAPKIETTVEVPSLAGLTVEEAKKALEALGLVMGKVKNVTSNNSLRG